jgi:hypothetical protein
MLEVDVWRAADLMIETHGDQAEKQAALKTEQLLEKGDMAGVVAWKNIMGAIIVLRAATPGFPESPDPLR